MKTVKRALAWCAIFIALSPVSAIFAADADPVVYSFVFLGCNRLDNAGIKATKSLSSANVIQLKQDFEEIATIRPAPQVVFFAGDIVNGLTAGTRDLETQLPAWVKLVTHKNPLDLSVTRL